MKSSRRLDVLVARHLATDEVGKKTRLRERIIEKVTCRFMRTVHEKNLFLETVVDTVAHVMDAGRVSILLRRGNHLVIAAARGLDREVVDWTRVALDEGVAGRVAASGLPVFMTDGRSSVPDMTSQLHGGARYSSPSFICLPLVTRGSMRGVLSVTNPRGRTWFTEYDRRFLRTIADVVSVFLRRTMQQTIAHPVVEIS